jgi:hypothetical protein
MIFSLLLSDMDEYKWIIYLVLGLIYFFARSKKKSPQQQAPDRDVDQSRPADAPVTFEDLLREIQQSKAPAPKPEIKPVSTYRQPQYPKYEDYDDKLEEEEKDLEDVGYDYKKQDNIYEVYEKAKQAAFHRPSLEETMKVEDTVVRFGQFKEYQNQEEPSLASTVAKDFQNPENVRKAFILSEILQRKY